MWNELWPVVGPDVGRCLVEAGQLLQHRHHILGLAAAADADRQAEAAVLVDHVQDHEPAAISGGQASGGGRPGKSHAQGSRREKLLSPERLRTDVVALRQHYRASEHQACRVFGQHRSTQRHNGKVVDLEEAKLKHRLRKIAAEHIRRGRWMAYRLLRREDWTVNHKRIQRLWRDEGLPPKPRRPAARHGWLLQRRF